MKLRLYKNYDIILLVTPINKDSFHIQLHATNGTGSGEEYVNERELNNIIKEKKLIKICLHDEYNHELIEPRYDGTHWRLFCKGCNEQLISFPYLPNIYQVKYKK